MIIDFHCHCGPGDGFTGPWNTHAPIGAYLQRARSAGIGRTVVFAAFHSDYRTANRAVATWVRRLPERLHGFAFVHAARDRGSIAGMVSEAVSEHGFRGIKVHRHDAPITREVCEVARSFRLPVLYDLAGEVASAELLAREFPTVNFVIPHLGSFADDPAAQRGLIPILERFPNLYADTSGVRRFDILEEAVRRAGVKKLLFGTDGPWLHPAVELAKIRALHLSPGGEAWITSGNASHLLHLPAFSP